MIDLNAPADVNTWFFCVAILLLIAACVGVGAVVAGEVRYHLDMRRLNRAYALYSLGARWALLARRIGG